ncbi:MAG: helix-turn-helix domain-containing protein [Saccharofermentans sp.]|nr:helix-turn-helix domain-containing protein [Saccharofermentans sp.]
MFHKAVDLQFGEGTILIVTFQTGEVKQYDLSCLFSKYPVLERLIDRDLFLSGKLVGQYGIIWNEEIDIEVETIYENGSTVSTSDALSCTEVGEALMRARASKEMSQKELSKISGIDQADISRIERGIANPSIKTLKRIASAMEMTVRIDFLE